MASPVFPNTFFTGGLDPTSDRIVQKFKELHGDTDFIRALLLSKTFYARVDCTAAQVKAAFTTPIIVVAAPGAGLMVVVDDLFASMVYNSATYSCNASGASLKYKADASGQSVGIALTQAYLQSSSGTNYAHVRGSATLYTAATADLANQPVVLLAASSDPTTGDSVLKLMVRYRVLPVPF